MIERFNIRAYLLITNEKGDLLVSDERIAGSLYTKFPGGGLEFGEGIAECLHREAMEEFGQRIELLGHLYTTDFFVESRFLPGDQVIAVYYLAHFAETPRFRTSTLQHDFEGLKDGEESFRWVPKEEIGPDLFSFETDRKALELWMANHL